MSIIKTEGIIEVSATVPGSIPPHGDDDVDKDLARIPFNDLEIVGGLPSSLNVVGISDIVIYNVQNEASQDDHKSKYVVGIETVYKLDNGKLSPPVLHGTKTKHLTRIQVKNHERIVAAFAGISSDNSTTGKIGALRFSKTNLKTGDVETGGYVATLRQGDSFTYSAAFGEIVGFQGIKSRGVLGRLVTLGVQTRYLGSL